MSKQAIGTCYILGVLVAVSVLLMHGGLALGTSLNSFGTDQTITANVIGIIILVGSGIVLGMIAWLGALVNLAKAQEWVWFSLLFCFGGILVLIYLLFGPGPSEADDDLGEEKALLRENSMPPSMSALEIVRQRYARGEIDAATFHQMSADLSSSEDPTH